MVLICTIELLRLAATIDSLKAFVDISKLPAANKERRFVHPSHVSLRLEIPAKNPVRRKMPEKLND